MSYLIARGRSHNLAESSSRYVLRFCPLTDDGHALAFPCNERGQVDIDGLSERAKLNYLYARTVVGRQFSMPVRTAG